MENRKRNVQIIIRVTEEERALIEEKMQQIPTLNLSAYARKMLIDGYIITLDLQEVKGHTAQLQKIGVNVNQIAKRINETGRIYADDMDEMKRVMEETMSQPDPEKALTQLYMYIMENQKHIRALSESVQFMALRRQMGEKVYQYFYNHLERIGMFKNLTMPEAAMAVQIIIFSVMGVAFDAPFKDEADVKERVATFMSVIRKCTGRDPMQVR